MMDINYLKSRWPSLKFVRKDKIIEVQIGQTSWFNLNPDTDIEHYSEMLDQYNQDISLQKRIMKEYPYLYIGISPGVIYAWKAIIRPNDFRVTDGEAIGDYSLKGYLDGDPNVLAALDRDNAEAKKACHPNYFYCTGHHRAEPLSEYGYNYFAGYYCKKYKEEHPKHYAMSTEPGLYN